MGGPETLPAGEVLSFFRLGGPTRTLHIDYNSAYGLCTEGVAENRSGHPHDLLNFMTTELAL